ncbi:hypothetical protein, partial [Glaciimonas sp. CA11.2]|uniref:hypothetical protein n=1 Tax=Glaciimonas sp. CA11.2 TaxID=3048601 RepID=UPI002B2224A6
MAHRFFLAEATPLLVAVVWQSNPRKTICYKIHYKQPNTHTDVNADLKNCVRSASSVKTRLIKGEYTGNPIT